MNKKIQIVLLLAMVIFTMLSCEKKAEPESRDEVEATDEIGAVVTEEAEEQAEPEPTEEDEWVGTCSFTTTNANDEMGTYYITTRTDGIQKGPGKIGYLNDDSIVLVGGQIDTFSSYVPDDNIEDVFPACEQELKLILDDLRPYGYENFEFIFNDSELVTVNDYEMCKYHGVHNYTIDDVPVSTNFVAYSTRLKANGAYAYWVVLDDTDDHSLTDVIEEHADRIATTFRELD